jgi:hypothetical protein
MNSHNITQRSNTTIRNKSNSSGIINISSSNDRKPTKKSSTQRVKRIRRKPKKSPKYSTTFLVPLVLGMFTSLLLVFVGYLLLSGDNKSHNNDDHFGNNEHVIPHTGRTDNNNEHTAAKEHSKKNKYNDLNAENPLPPHQKKDQEEEGETGGIFGFGKTRDKHGKYRHSDYLSHIGDHSIHYTQMRQSIDEKLPKENIQRMRDFVDSIKENTYTPIMKHEMIYDIYNCPEYPPPNYPMAWNVRDVLENWPPDDTSTIRPHIYQGLCVFDHETERQKAINYRVAEVPFVVQNDPQVLRTVERWNQPAYLQELLGKTKYRTEFSHDNHFMYWQKPTKKMKEKGRVPEDWEPPTHMTRMKFESWLEHANVTDKALLQPNRDHWYYRLIGCGEMGDCDRDSSEYLFDELPFFQPREENNLYMVEPRKQKGIHCRFGMEGVIAENHFDGSRYVYLYAFSFGI